MTAQHDPGSDAATTQEVSTDEATADGVSTGGSSTERSPTDGDRELHLRASADALAGALDAAGAVVEECLLSLEDGFVLRARDPADVVMAEFSLPEAAFESYAAADQRFGVPLERFADAVSMADGDPVTVTLDDRDRLHVDAGPVEYALAPIDPRAVRTVEWMDDQDTAARAVLDAGALRRAVRATDLVADHATMTVDEDAGTFAVSASGDTDDVRTAFGDEELSELDIGPVDSIYSLDYLQRIVGAVPSGVSVELAFLDTAGRDGRILAVRHSFAGGDGSARWLLAPRLKR